GVVFDLGAGSLSLPRDKVMSIYRQCRPSWRVPHVPPSSGRLVGTLNFASSFCATGRSSSSPLGFLDEHLYFSLLQGCASSLGYGFRITFGVWMDVDLLEASVPMSLPTPSLHLMTDSSLYGWSGVLLPHSVSGVWPPSYAGMSINWLELMAVKNSLQEFVLLLQGQCVLLMSDNTTSVACLRRQGLIVRRN
ncbi:unnamed protein product, partial [Meganyctiphanes norvegica]